MRAKSPWRRILFTPVPWLLVVAVAVVQWIVIDDVAADVDGDSPLGYLLMFGSVIPVSWAVLETMWVRFDGPRPLVALGRTLVLPLIMGPVVGLTAVLVRYRPGVEDTIEAVRRPDGWHYWFDASRGGGGIWSDAALVVLANTFMPMLAGLGLVVFVVLPWFAFFRPAEFVEANMMDTSPAHAAANAAGARVLSVILMLTFAVPTAIVWLSNEGRTGLGWLLGITMVVVGIALTRFVLSRQVPDHVRRADLPQWAKGIRTVRHEAEQERRAEGRDPS
ncbi:hypothetical protein IDH50_07385 [Aeromicrobium tamlense]|uniref:Uncharacterized protein n=1 Tax=Aeromicrobium tamlense TaxID=375541 RepID=A0A8I0FTH7_9ACTN|nr:hypothetical protein [Aeromicrobium tamlense]MBD1270047.1 hypothetical protein [Aeromicrobium tamlense]NYI39295.1 hypothetical protein [Aeromicrobium tamlense]